jgi:biopolymer transport protein ExbB
MHGRVPGRRWFGRTTAAVVLTAALAAGTGGAAAQAPSDGPASGETVLLPDGPAQTGAPAALPPSAIPTKNLLQVVRDGGPVMIPLAGCSFLLFVFVFERLVSLRRGRVIPRPFVKRFLEQMQEGQLDREAALELCAENRSPVAEIFAGAVRKWGRPAVEVEQAIIDAGERVTNGLRKYLRILNGISTVSPLLGLLGTVLGMIHCFNTISRFDGMGRSELLAGGIGEALLSTAAGLCVAIPAMIAYLCFVGRVDQLIMEMDKVSQPLVDLVSAEGGMADNLERRTSAPRHKEAA